MSALHGHIVAAPIVLPLVLGALMLLFDERRVLVKGIVGCAGAFTGVAVAVMLVLTADLPVTQVYRIGDWPAPFGIVLVADRLSAAMVLLSSVVGASALVFSLARWHRAGPRFHTLFQFLLMGVNGAFLTGDLFNLFVFFEVLLAASYGLALHGSGTPRVTASLHYIAINLTASLLFLIGVSLIYGVTGTLSMADVATRAANIAPGDRVLLEAAAAILGIAFLVKAGTWPLCFWLPGTYSAAGAPVAAVFAILTKVGIYSVLRMQLLLFGTGEGESGGFGGDWLVAAGMATLTFGAVGLLASRNVPRVASYSLLVSSGTLLASIGFGGIAATGAALYYLAVSTFGISALFLLGELVEQISTPGAAMLAVSAEYFGDVEEDASPEENIGVAIPATTAILGLIFASCALLIAGLPPFPGFIAKFAILAALLQAKPITAGVWLMVALLVLSGLAAIVAIGREGIRIFWASETPTVPPVRLLEILPVVVLLGLCASLAMDAGAALRYFDAAAQSLHAPRGYIDAVRGTP